MIAYPNVMKDITVPGSVFQILKFFLKFGQGFPMNGVNKEKTNFKEVEPEQ